MRTIINKTTKPLKVPLPQAKVLHLGPLKEGQISVHDVDHPPLQELVAAGTIELVDDGAHGSSAGPTKDTAHADTHGHHPDTSVHRRGDR